jgi:chromosome segregation ATPase
MAENTGSEANKGTGQGTGEDKGIAGTSFKTPEDLAAAYQNLEKKLGEQGNELGTLRKEKESLSGQAQTLAETLKEHLTKANAVAAPADKAVDYGAEIQSAKAELKKLDPMEAEYASKQAELVDKIANLAALGQHAKTLDAAGNMFKKELDQRDAKAAQDAFYRENPTFNTPETQAKIRQYIANDKTGMHDPMSAFFQIERDEAAAKAAGLAKENDEYKKLVELAKGKDEAGKVIVAGQGTGQQQTKQPKVTGKDLDAGMLEALNKAT